MRAEKMKENGMAFALLLGLLIGLWWCGVFVANVVSRNLLADEGEESITNEGLISGFWTFEWVELTVFQHITASIVATVVAKFTGHSVWQICCTTNQKKVIFVATFYHFLGSLAVNAAYNIVESDIAHVIRACQPLVTFLLSANLRVSGLSSFSLISNFVSVMVIVIGVGMFQYNSTSVMFNFWGFGAALISSLAFSGRNVLLKEGNKNWDSTLEKFVVVSSLSAVFSLLLWLLKAALTETYITSRFLGSGGISACIVYPAYSFASFKVLEMVTPVTHAIVTILIWMLSSVENFLIFGPVNLTSNTVFFLFVIAFGLFLYFYTHTKSSWFILKLVSLIAAAVGLYLLALHDIPIRDDADGEPHGNYNGLQSMTALRQQEQNRGISTAWLYDRPITENIVANIGDLGDINPTMKVYVYCGTTQCVREVAALEKENVVVGFAVMSDIVKGIPLERWVAHHPINKLLAGQEFENHLHEVAILGILWQYGGYYVNPMVRTIGRLPKYHNGTIAVVSEEATVSKGSLPSVFDVAYFSKYHPTINSLAVEFYKKYPSFRSPSPFSFDFMDAVWKTVQSKFNNTLNTLSSEEAPSVTSHYGILSHSSPALTQNNLDDEMENFAGIQYLPFVDSVIERRDLRSFTSSDNITAFFNGKWGVSEGRDVPLNSLNPVMLSVHLESGVRRNLSGHLQTHEPIGYRDTVTLDYLQANGIKNFLSSLMLLMKNPYSYNDQGPICIAEVGEERVHLLPLEVQGKAIDDVQHEMGESGALVQSKAAYELIEKFASASLVITENLQYALSCVAMGTPVICIDTSSKGGERSQVPAEIASLVHMVDMRTMTESEVRKWFQNFPWDSIPQNPNPAMLMRLRATSWNVLRQNQHLHDAAVRFGAVPMFPPLSLQAEKKMVFYLVFSTSENSSLSISKSLKKHSGRFNWRHWRSVESIFYHHPTAEVKVYSNTLPGNTFDVLTEAGYSIQVTRYRLEDLLKGTPAEGFIKKLRKARNTPFWYSNVSNLLRMLLLYKWGGIYMDTDVIVVKPLHLLKTNTLGWEDEFMILANGAFAKFEKGNLFLEAALKEFVKNFRGDIWGNNGPQLLTQVYRKREWSSDVIHIVDYKLFYMISGNNMQKQCFQKSNGVTFNSNMRTLKTKAYVVHTNSKISGNLGIEGGRLETGTICKHLLNAYCVLCDQIH